MFFNISTSIFFFLYLLFSNRFINCNVKIIFADNVNKPLNLSLIKIKSSDSSVELDTGYLGDEEDNCDETDHHHHGILGLDGYDTDSDGSELCFNGHDTDGCYDSSDSKSSQSNIDSASEFDSRTLSELCFSSGSVSGTRYLGSDHYSIKNDYNFDDSFSSTTFSSQSSLSSDSSSTYYSCVSSPQELDGYSSESEEYDIYCSSVSFEEIIKLLENDDLAGLEKIRTRSLLDSIDRLLSDSQDILETISSLESDYLSCIETLNKPKYEKKRASTVAYYSSTLGNYNDILEKYYNFGYLLLKFIFNKKEQHFSLLLLNLEKIANEFEIRRRTLVYLESELSLINFYITKFRCEFSNFILSKLCSFLFKIQSKYEQEYSAVKSSLELILNSNEITQGRKQESRRHKTRTRRRKSKKRVITGRKKAIVGGKYASKKKKTKLKRRV
ncbi:hypothetical protein FG379_001518 [Cryptosporidium bovis]|uniref:uncharacterized protein n=1 Tax=Cryptosporidium bovis TaxID=310047 RepID=UPI003519E57D|nr:hypothetical protein FG379_001518 [Cryptosporidium bovis]